MRYILKISYDGRNFSGYQVQNNKETIQGCLEKALCDVIKEEINIVASGRTDAGVSALLQICHFDTLQPINTRRTMSYANTLLPDEIRIIDIIETSQDFHARFSAKKKTYEYYFYTGARNPIYDNYAQYICQTLDIDAMQESCKYLIGEHDFSSFCASNTSVVDKVRYIYEAKVQMIDDNLYKMVITGNGFLYNMVRIIMGTLVMVGQRKIESSKMKEIIENKDRSSAGKTMPSKGLMLKNVVY